MKASMWRGVVVSAIVCARAERDGCGFGFGFGFGRVGF